MSKTDAKTDTTSPQQLAGAAQDSGAGVKDKPVAPKSSAKALYVVGACPVLHDHEVYQPGDELKLTESEAARLGNKVAAVKA